MKNKNILIGFLIATLFLGGYAGFKIFNSSKKITENFKRFDSFTVLKTELEAGNYTLFEVSEDSDEEKEQENENYRIIVMQENPKVIEILPDTLYIGKDSKKKMKVNVTIRFLGEKIRSIGTFTVDKKQEVTIISKIDNDKIKGFAYKSQSKKSDFYGVIKYVLLLVLSGLMFLILGIFYLLKK